MDQPIGNVIVNAGCLLLFNTQAHHQDVLDSTLYVQLAASKKHSKFTDYDSWRQTWLDAALRFGWMSRASERFGQPVPDDQPSTLWGWAKALRPDFVDQALLERSEALLTRCPVSQPAFDVLAGQVLGPGATALAMQVGLVDSNGSLTLLQLRFDSRQAMSREQLFGPWSKELVKGNIAMSFHRLSLSEALYAPLREAFAKALCDRRPGLVCPVLEDGGQP